MVSLIQTKFPFNSLYHRVAQIFETGFCHDIHGNFDDIRGFDNRKCFGAG